VSNSPSDLIWFNGEVIPMSEARIGVEDRGYQFADGVYEMMRLYNKKPFALKEHLDRLTRSAAGIRLPLPMPVEKIGEEIIKFIPRAAKDEGSIYLQLTRGIASPRNHALPKTPGSTLLFYHRAAPLPPGPGEGEGVKLLALPDERWKRCWIKSIALIANVLAKAEAMDKGFDEAAFVEHGIVSECCTSNLFAVLGGRVITHPQGAKILPGITRQIVLECAAKVNVAVEERPLREEEVQRADEVFITSTTRELHWVARWNDRYIGQGKCGPVTIKLHRAFGERVRAETT
jgi:D-alanine transaminase